MAQVTPLLLAELTASCAAALPPSCISGFHSEPLLLCQSAGGFAECTAWLCAQRQAVLPFSRRAFPEEAEEGSAPVHSAGDCVGDS